MPLKQVIVRSLLFQEIAPELLTAEGIPLPVQLCHLERHKVDVGVHRPCDLPHIIPLVDVFQYLIVRERDLRREDVGLILHAPVPHIEDIELLKAPGADRLVPVQRVMADLM